MENANGKAVKIGHWPLRADSRDTSAFGRHGIAEGVRYADAALFDGISSRVTLPDIPETDGSRTFTLSLEFEVDDERGNLPGSLCSRYGQERMEGWHLSVLTQAGVTSTQSNWRNLQFGWSTGQPVDEWTDWGSPGDSRCICALCVHDGSLYAGTFDDAQDGLGRVYRFQEDGSWENCGNPDRSNSVFALAEFNGRLYAGTMRYRAGGSHIPGSPNLEPGGKIFRYEGGQTWSFFAELPVENNDSVGAMTVYDNRLIAMSFYPHGIFAFDEAGNMQDLGAPGPHGTTRTHTLAPFRGRLFVGCNETSGVYSRTLDTPWEYNGIVPHCDQVYCFAAYHNELMMGIWKESRMYRYEGGTEWTDRGLMGSELEVMGVSVYNGRLYAGTLPGGHVYRYNGGTEWALSGVLEEPNPEIEYRRVWSMAVYDGRLFAGTLPAGKVWSLRSGPLATRDAALPAGWHRATAVYDRQSLSLYLDGQFVSKADISPQSPIRPLDNVPLVLGQGPQSRFSGRMREVELFDGALAAEEITVRDAAPGLGEFR